MSHSLIAEKAGIIIAVLGLSWCLFKLWRMYHKKPEPDEYEVMYDEYKKH